MEGNYSELIKTLLNELEQDISNPDVIDETLQSIYSTKGLEHQPITKGQKAADLVANFVGSWAFIISFTVFLAVWIILNLYFLTQPFDPFPFILLNLILSCIAAIQAPLVMMSQNRHSEIDRMKNDNDFRVNLKNEVITVQIYIELLKLKEQHQALRADLLKHEMETLEENN